jgi:sugar lactone lactonase YvrE
MAQSLQNQSVSKFGVSRIRRSWALTATALVCGSFMVSACGDDDDTDNNTGNGGRAGNGGSAGTTGNAGAAGAAGASNGGTSNGGAGNAGAAGAAGAGGAPGAEGPTGSVTVLNDDAADLNGPTTAAIRGEDLWVVNGQLSSLFTNTAPALPFNLVSVPLDGGDIGATEIALPGADFFPEGIAADEEGTLYIGSLNLGTIVRVPAGSTTADADLFVVDGVAERGVVGLTVDEDRDLLWFCDSGIGAPGGALVGVDLEDGTETVRHELPDPVAAGDADAGAGADAGDAGVGDAGAGVVVSTFCNDVIVAPNDDIFITDSSGRIFRIEDDDATTANSAEVWLADPAIAPPQPGGFGANGITFVDGNLIVAANGNLVAIDPSEDNPASTVRVITLTGGAALCGPDGLEEDGGDVIVIENGSCPAGLERVARVTLEGL